MKTGLAPLLPTACLSLLLTLGTGMARADEYATVEQLLRAGQVAEASARVDRFLAAQPRDPRMRFLKGQLLRDAGLVEQAAALYTGLTQDYPELPEPYNNLAALQAKQGLLEEARASLEMALRLRPDYAAAHENLGDVLAALAVRAYAQALSHEAGNAPLQAKLERLRQVLAIPISRQP